VRRTARTRAILEAIERNPGRSSRELGALAGVKDAGQLSKLLHRLEREGLVEHKRQDWLQGRPLHWWLTEMGRLATWKAPT